MPRMHKVTLSRSPQTTPDSDGFFEDLSPREWYAAIQPLNPTNSDGTRIQGYYVTGRFHSGITVDTRIVWDDAGTSRELFVKGVQNVDAARKTLLLYCEATA